MATDSSGRDKPGPETGQLNEQLGVAAGGTKRPPATSGDTRRSTRRGGDDGSTP